MIKGSSIVKIVKRAPLRCPVCGKVGREISDMFNCFKNHSYIHCDNCGASWFDLFTSEDDVKKYIGFSIMEDSTYEEYSSDGALIMSSKINDDISLDDVDIAHEIDFKTELEKNAD